MHEPTSAPVEPITVRQLEVARLIEAGRTNPEIAEELGITLAGAKYHVSELLGRLNLQRREEIATWYRAHRGTPITRARRRLRAIGLAPLAWAGGGAAVMLAVVALVVALDGAREDGGGGAASAAPTPSVAEPIDVLHINDLPPGTVRTFELRTSGLVELEPDPDTWFTIDASPYGFHLAHLPSGEVRAYSWHDTQLGYRTFWSLEHPWPGGPGGQYAELGDPRGMFYARHGLIYRIEGDRIFGPGANELDQFAVDLRSNGRIWVDLSSMIEGERGGSTADATPTPPNEFVLLFGEYEVQGGDTLDAIAARFDIEVEYLYWNNPGMDGEEPEAGTHLRIPAVEGIIYHVQPGDRIDALAEHYGVEPAAILDFPGNGLGGDADNLREGRIILIPSGRLEAH